MADGETGREIERIAGDGVWEGWTLVRGLDPYEDLAGPFYYRDEPDGSRRSAFIAEAKHLNGGGALHGGLLMTFADFSLFMIGHAALGPGSGGVTISLNGEFTAAAGLGERIESRGDVTRAGKSLVFVRGLIESNGLILLNFSGVIKKVRHS